MTAPAAMQGDDRVQRRRKQARDCYYRNRVLKRKPYMDRLMERIMPEPMSGCWLWTGTIHKKGYGVISYLGKKWKAHRLSWTLLKGEIADELHVLHKCDTLSCINPDHLYVGTNAENVADKMRKNRQSKIAGTKIGTAKLTDEKAAAIRLDRRSWSKIARSFGIRRSAVHRIKSRQTWRHVP